MDAIWWVLIVMLVLGAAAGVWAAIYYGELRRGGSKQ